MLAERGKSIDHVLRLKVDDQVLIERVAKRFSESARPDDNPESFKVRLAAYNSQTAPLLDYYRDSGKLTELDGMATVEAVSGAIDAALAR
jgi:adenylate kinase